MFSRGSSVQELKTQALVVACPICFALGRITLPESSSAICCLSLEDYFPLYKVMQFIACKYFLHKCKMSLGDFQEASTLLYF